MANLFRCGSNQNSNLVNYPELYTSYVNRRDNNSIYADSYLYFDVSNFNGLTITYTNQAVQVSASNDKTNWTILVAQTNSSSPLSIDISQYKYLCLRWTASTNIAKTCDYKWSK